MAAARRGLAALATRPPLSARAITIVKATAPVIAPRALELTRHFYGKMFASNPEVLHFFNQANNRKDGGQPQALANAIVAYATNIEKLDVLGGAVNAMAVKHCGLQVLPSTHACVCVRACVCLHACMRVSMHKMHVYTKFRCCLSTMPPCTTTHACVCVAFCVRAYACMRACVHACVHTQNDVCI